MNHSWRTLKQRLTCSASFTSSHQHRSDRYRHIAACVTQLTGSRALETTPTFLRLCTCILVFKFKFKFKFNLNILVLAIAPRS